ncbi:MAG TPA: SirB2 family protein [Luteimonas sp.]
MIEFYPQIRYVHILAVTLSGCLFAVRGLAVLMGMRWPLWGPVRYLSWTIDTVLLTAALMLLTILPGALFANGWLTLKLLLVVVYVVLGVFALKRASTRRRKAVFYVLALATFLAIVGIARMHSPWGWLLPYIS